MVCINFQSHFGGLISSTSLAEQPGLVVVKTRVTVDDALEHQLFARRYNQ